MNEELQNITVDSPIDSSNETTETTAQTIDNGSTLVESSPIPVDVDYTVYFHVLICLFAFYIGTFLVSLFAKGVK